MKRFRLTDEKKRVVLDTNVVVSAALTPQGISAEIFEMLIQGAIENFTSDEIMEEIRDVLRRPKFNKVDKNYLQYIIENFEKLSRKINPEIKIDAIKEDPDDNKFLEVAVSEKTDYIISGDGHIKTLKEFYGIRIVSPSEFLEEV